MTTVSQALNTQDNSPAALVKRYGNDITSTLPSHIGHDQWLSIALAAARDPKVAEAATNNPAAFFHALRYAARLGLEPNTEQFYLVPQPPKAGAQAEIMGIVGWQGIVELIYRAGAVSSVIAEVVRQKDGFAYEPGNDERPRHIIDWDLEDRGGLRLVYAYAIMKDKATSKVIVLNKADIALIKKSSKSANSDYSPWNKHEASMWLKSAVRQLAKWVPTSAEYRKEILRAAQEVAAEQNIDLDTGEVLNGELIS